MKFLEFADERVGLALAGTVFVNVLRRSLTMKQMAEVRRVVAKQQARGEASARGAITVLELSALDSIDEEARRDSARLMSEVRSAAAATVVEGRGFRAVAGRAIISGLYLVSRPPYQHRVFSDAEEGARWMGALVAGKPAAPTAKEISEAIAEARAAILSPKVD